MSQLGELPSCRSTARRADRSIRHPGGGLQTSYVHTSPDDDDDVDTFAVDHARLYVSGTVAPKTKFMFNTDYYSADNTIGVMDAVVQFEFSEKFNIWGRPFPAAKRPRQSLRSVLLASLGGVHRRRPGRLSVHLPGSGQRRPVPGGSSAYSSYRAGPSMASLLPEIRPRWAPAACRSISGIRNLATTRMAPTTAPRICWQSGWQGRCRAAINRHGPPT